jgi:hypothetical protein
VEVAHSVGAVIGRWHPVGVLVGGSARAGGGSDAERAKLVESEDSVREAVNDFLDPVQLRLAVRVRGFLPCLCALEGDAAASEQAA